MDSQPTQPLSYWDAFWILGWSLLLLTLCAFLSHGREFWSDELFGLLLIRDPSFSHMLFAWRSGADGGGIIFYLLARVWCHLFGITPLAFRLVTAFCMALGLAFTWLAARRWYRLEIVAFSIPFCWFTAHSLLRQLMIGRFYGTLVATTALAVYGFSLVAKRKRPGYLALLASFASHLVLVGTHPFGIVFSAAIIVSLITVDTLQRDWRPGLYAAALAGWIILWPSRCALRASAAIGKPHFWTKTPTIPDLLQGFSLWTDELQWFWLGLLLALCIGWRLIDRHKQPAVQSRDVPSWVVGFAFTATIPLVWLLSLRGPSYFVDRYLLPTIIGAALLQSAALQRLIPVQRPRWAQMLLVLGGCSLAAAAVWSLMVDVPQYHEPPHAYTSSLVPSLPPNTPIVVERVDIFVEMVTSLPHLQLRYLTDWETALIPESPRGEVSGFHEMENWKNVGFYAQSIDSSASFLASHPEFWVIADSQELWFKRRVQSNPSYWTEKMGQLQREGVTETIWHVRTLQKTHKPSTTMNLPRQPHIATRHP